MKTVLLVVICIALGFSCSKSGRRGKNNSSSHKTRPLPVLVNSEKSDRSPQVPDKRKTNTKRIMSGTEIFEQYNSAVFMIYTSDGQNCYQGSGFFVNANGVAVSNYHVFQGTTIGYEQIKLSDGNFYKVKRIIAKNPDEDYIIFQVDIDRNKINYIPMATQLPKVGEKVYAIGSPLGLENTFSSGEISQIRSDNFIQISVPIDHGSSGGALINNRGEVIGITSGGRDDSGANLNFAKSIQVIRLKLE